MLAGGRGSGAKLSRHFGTSLMVPKCIGSQVSWVRSVLIPHKTPPENSDLWLCRCMDFWSGKMWRNTADIICGCGDADMPPMNVCLYLYGTFCFKHCWRSDMGRQGTHWSL